MCPHSPESHPYFGLRKQNSGQKGKGGDPAPLLCSDETSPGVLHSDVESSVQERCRPVGVHPEEGHKNDSRIEHLPYKDRLRAGAVWSGGEKELD